MTWNRIKGWWRRLRAARDLEEALEDLYESTGGAEQGWADPCHGCGIYYEDNVQGHDPECFYERARRALEKARCGKELRTESR